MIHTSSNEPVLKLAESIVVEPPATFCSPPTTPDSDSMTDLSVKVMSELIAPLIDYLNQHWSAVGFFRDLFKSSSANLNSEMGKSGYIIITLPKGVKLRGPSRGSPWFQGEISHRPWAALERAIRNFHSSGPLTFTLYSHFDLFSGESNNNLHVGFEGSSFEPTAARDQIGQLIAHLRASSNQALAAASDFLPGEFRYGFDLDDLRHLDLRQRMTASALIWP